MGESGAIIEPASTPMCAVTGPLYSGIYLQQQGWVSRSKRQQEQSKQQLEQQDSGERAQHVVPWFGEERVRQSIDPPEAHLWDRTRTKEIRVALC